MKKFLLGVLWIVCGYLSYGYALGDFTSEFPADDNIGISVFMAAAGPFGLIAATVAGGTNHWRLKPLTTEERYQHFHSEFPDLDRAYFDQKYN